MLRLSALTAAIVLAACARHTPPPPAAAPAARSESPAPPVPRPQTQSETEQATASQESADGDTEQAKSDASLEQIAGSGAQLPSGKWQAGVNYDPLVPAQPTSVAAGKVEVLEIFWLACPHCYTLEPYLQGWLRTKPSYIEFVRVPVNWQSIYGAHARLYYTLEELARPDLIAKAFATIHETSPTTSRLSTRTTPARPSACSSSSRCRTASAALTLRGPTTPLRWLPTSRRRKRSRSAITSRECRSWW